MDRENFYSLLGLEPGVTLDGILRALDLKLAEWNRDDIPDQLRYRNQEYRRLEPLIRKVMTDKSLRDQEATDWYQRRSHDQDLARTALLDPIRLVLESFKKHPGYISEEGLAILGDNYGIPVDDSELIGLIEDVQIPVKPVVGDRINSSRSDNYALPRRLEEFLSDVGEQDLYRFLGLQSDAALEELQHISSVMAARYRDAVNRFGENESRKRVAGICVSVFGNQTRRDVYDRYLENKEHDRIKAPILELAENIASLNSGTLEAQYTDHLIGLAVDGGLSRVDMMSDLVQLATEKGWDVKFPEVVGDIRDHNEYLACKNGHISPRKGEDERPRLVCPECRSPLTNFVKCPGCGRQNPASMDYCNRAGCKTPLR